MELTAARLLKALQGLPFASRYWVAFSGGLDSTVLLHTLADASREMTSGSEVVAVHVHHGLHGQADAWAARCEALCRRWSVPCRVLRVDARANPGESPEAAARLARYAALGSMMKPGDGLLTAHHQDDQAETLLLQLLRGAGPRGLAGMPGWAPFTAGWLGRPLLAWSRAELHDYAVQHGLDWIEDPSNADTGLARNFLRKDILPRLVEHWPGTAHTLARVAAHQAEAAELLAECGKADLKGTLASDGGLNIVALRALGGARQRNLLRSWLHDRGLPLPDTVHLQRILDEVIAARPDAGPRVAWGGADDCGAEVRRYRDRIYALRSSAVCSGQGPLDWNLVDPLALPGLPVRLISRPVKGSGLSVAACEGRTITVRFRCGGERCRPIARGHRHALKKLFQEWGVAPWLRERVPLIYVDNTLAQVVGYCLCEPFAAVADEPGWCVETETAATD